LVAVVFASAYADDVADDAVGEDVLVVVDYRQVDVSPGVALLLFFISEKFYKIKLLCTDNIHIFSNVQ
jgi:hypothetical protein